MFSTNPDSHLSLLVVHIYNTTKESINDIPDQLTGLDNFDRF